MSCRVLAALFSLAMLGGSAPRGHELVALLDEWSLGDRAPATLSWRCACGDTGPVDADARARHRTLDENVSTWPRSNVVFFCNRCEGVFDVKLEYPRVHFLVPRVDPGVPARVRAERDGLVVEVLSNGRQVRCRDRTGSIRWDIDAVTPFLANPLARASCRRCGSKLETGGIGLDTDPEIGELRFYGEAVIAIAGRTTIWIDLATGHVNAHGRG